MSSINPLDPWALPPPLTDRRRDPGHPSSTSAPPGPASLRPLDQQSQAREPGAPTNRLDVRALLGSGRGRAILQRLGAFEISPSSNPQNQPHPAVDALTSFL